MIPIEEPFEHLGPGPLDGNRIIDLEEDLPELSKEGTRVYVKELGYDVRYNAAGEWEPVEGTGSQTIVNDLYEKLAKGQKYIEPIQAELNGETEYTHEAFEDVDLKYIRVITTSGDLRTRQSTRKKPDEPNTIEFGSAIYGTVIFEIIKANS